MKSKAEIKHDNIVKGLEEILNDKYDKINIFFQYCRNGQIGEVDLIGLYDDLIDFYEVKTTYGKKQLGKAQSQYDRFKGAFKEKRRVISGYFYTPDFFIPLK